jgi:hypothetical protein
VQTFEQLHQAGGQRKSTLSGATAIGVLSSRLNFTCLANTLGAMISPCKLPEIGADLEC